jgi:hypothetical protein
VELITSPVWNHKVHYRGHKRPPPPPLLVRHRAPCPFHGVLFFPLLIFYYYTSPLPSSSRSILLDRTRSSSGFGSVQRHVTLLGASGVQILTDYKQQCHVLLHLSSVSGCIRRQSAQPRPDRSAIPCSGGEQTAHGESPAAGCDAVESGCCH